MLPMRATMPPRIDAGSTFVRQRHRPAGGTGPVAPVLRSPGRAGKARGRGHFGSDDVLMIQQALAVHGQKIGQQRQPIAIGKHHQQLRPPASRGSQPRRAVARRWPSCAPPASPGSSATLCSARMLSSTLTKAARSCLSPFGDRFRNGDVEQRSRVSGRRSPRCHSSTCCRINARSRPGGRARGRYASEPAEALASTAERAPTLVPERHKHLIYTTENGRSRHGRSLSSSEAYFARR